MELDGESTHGASTRPLPISVVGYVLSEVADLAEDEVYVVAEKLVRRLDEWGMSVVPTRFVDPSYRV